MIIYHWEKRRQRMRQSSALVAVTIWWTTTQCREKKHNIHSQECLYDVWLNKPFSCSTSTVMISFFSSLVPLLDTRDFFLFSILFLHIDGIDWPCTWPLSLSLSLSVYYDTLIQDKNVDGYWTLNEI